MVKTQTITEFVGEAGSKRFNCLAVEFKVPPSVSGGVTYNTAYVGGRPVEAGSTFSINQIDGFIDISQYDIAFEGSDTSALFITYVVPLDRRPDESMGE
jgi:hypothetical protein